MNIILLVPRCYVENEKPDEKCDTSLPLLKSLGHYCMKNEKCRRIIHFLTLSGKHDVVANTQIMYQEAIISYGNIHVESFKELLDEVLYKIFEKRFENKNTYLMNTTFINVFGSETIDNSQSHKRIEKVKSIKSEEDCIKDGPDCVTAISILDDTLNRLYRILSVLNEGNLDNDRNYGTLMTNMISKLDPVERANLDEKKDVMVAFSKLQMELKNLFRQIVPASHLPLTSFFELLGYSDNFFLNIEKNSTHSNKDSAGKCRAKYSEEGDSKSHFATREDDWLESNLERVSCSFESLNQFWSEPSLKNLYDEATKEHNSDMGMIKYELCMRSC